MYYLIKYEESVENRVAIALTENPQNEIAVLALADYEDETISIDEIYCILSEGQTDLAAKINMEDQMKRITRSPSLFIRICMQRKKFHFQQ